MPREQIIEDMVAISMTDSSFELTMMYETDPRHPTIFFQIQNWYVYSHSIGNIPRNEAKAFNYVKHSVIYEVM